MRLQPHHLRLLLAVIMLPAALLAACGDNDDGPGAPGNITVNDLEGRAIEVVGDDFNSEVLVHLSLHSVAATEADPPPAYLGSVRTTAAGQFAQRVEIPAEWPNGVPIRSQRLAVLAAAAGIDTPGADMAIFDFDAPGAAQQPTATATAALSLQELRMRLTANVSGLDPNDVTALRVEGINS